MRQNQASDYTGKNHSAQFQYTPAPGGGQSRPAVLRRRIGSTTYRVCVHFSDTSRETVNDKILRLAKREVETYEKAA